MTHISPTDSLVAAEGCSAFANWPCISSKTPPFCALKPHPNPSHSGGFMCPVSSCADGTSAPRSARKFMNIHSVKLGRARGVWCRAARMRRLGSTIQACCADRQQTTLRSPAAPGSIPPGDPHINRKLFSRAFQNSSQNKKRPTDAKVIRRTPKVLFSEAICD